MDEENVVVTEPVVEEEAGKKEACTCDEKCCCECEESKKLANPFALIGFILSLCSPLTIPSLIISIIGLAKAKDYKGSNKGFAIAGMVISILSIVAVVLTFITCLTALVAVLPVLIEKFPEIFKQINFPM